MNKSTIFYLLSLVFLLGYSEKVSSNIAVTAPDNYIFQKTHYPIALNLSLNNRCDQWPLIISPYQLYHAYLFNPTIKCPVNVTVHCEVGANPAKTGTASATDNCTTIPSEISNITYSDGRTNGSCRDNYTVLRTWSAIDSCNILSTCTQIITVFDTFRPRIYCPENITITCEANTLPASTGTAAALDNCSDKITNYTYQDTRTNGACHDDYSLHREWRAVDSCGNSNTCSQLIIIQDYTKPAITCSSNITIDCEASTLPANTGKATATDNCTNVVTNITYDDALAFEGNGSYTILRTWSAVDSCSNLRTCLQKITIGDTLKPDSIRITNSSIANDGKIEFYITGADSLDWFNLSNNRYVNNNGLNLSPGEYYAKVYKDSCLLLYGPFQIQLINLLHDLTELKLKAFPVPFKDEISIGAESSSVLEYSLLNIQGRILQRGIFRHELKIETGHLNTGVYFLKCFDENKSGMIRLIKL